MKYLLIVTLILGSFIFSCSNSTSSNEVEKISLPLKVGNSWTYQITYINYSTNSPEIVKELDEVFTVISDTLIDGDKWFFISSSNESLNRLMGGYYSNQEDGIHYKYSFDGSLLEKTVTDLVPFPGDYFPLKSSVSQSKEYPFIHNPDTEIPERLIVSEDIIGSVTYENESFDEEFETITQNYTWNYYQQTINDRIYTIAPFDQHYAVSNEIGFTIFERAFASKLGSSEEDPRLRLLTIIRFKLKEFNLN
ncbi:MAG: hypothetical protein ACMZ7B_12995 [Balneola sp.]